MGITPDTIISTIQPRGGRESQPNVLSSLHVSPSTSKWESDEIRAADETGEREPESVELETPLRFDNGQDCEVDGKPMTSNALKSHNARLKKRNELQELKNTEASLEWEVANCRRRPFNVMWACSIDTLSQILHVNSDGLKWKTDQRSGEDGSPEHVWVSYGGGGFRRLDEVTAEVQEMRRSQSGTEGEE